MSAPRFPRALFLPATTAALSAAAVPGFPHVVLGVFALAAVVRLVLSRRGREWEGPRFWLLFWTLAPCVAATLVPILAQVGVPAATSILAAGVVALAVALVAPGSPASWARVLLLAAGVTTGVCLAAPPELGIAATCVFLVVAVPSVLALPIEARSLARAPDGPLRRVRAEASPGDRRRARWTAAATLLGVGLAAGGWLFVALPRGSFSLTAREDARPATTDDEAVGGAGGPAGTRRRLDDEGITGPTAARRSGFQRSLRLNPQIVLNVRVERGVRGPEPLWLRGLAYDRFDGTGWTRTPEAGADRELPLDGDGWHQVGPETAERPIWRVQYADVGGRATRTALWTLPGARLVRLPARDRASWLRGAADGALFLAPSVRWEEGAVYETRGAASGHDRGGLERLASSAAVAPLESLTQPPPEADAFRALATTIVGAETTAAGRAARLEAWLRSPPFAHALADLDADPKRPVADFLFRSKRGHCWCFASAMTLMLRSLGIPARMATGLRGGEYLERVGAWTFRGSHAHAWCEVWYAGRGFVIYDPTPAAAGASEDFTTDELRAGGGDGAATRWLRGVGDTATALVGGIPTSAWIGAGIAVLLGLLWRWRRAARDAAMAALAGAAGTAWRGPYVRALAALGAAGTTRRPRETPREYLRKAATAVPEVATPLGALTAAHDGERYGGEVPDPLARRAAEVAADAVVAATKRPRHR